MTTDKTTSPAGATSFAAIPNNAADSWWRDPGLRMNVMHCMGLCFCVYYLGYDASLLTGLQAVPAWQDYFGHPTGNWLGLISATLFLPSPISAFIGDWICNRFGRRPAVWLGSGITLIGIIFMTACQSTLQFMGSRLILGFGGTIAKVAAPALLQEIAHPRIRSAMATMYWTFYFVGSIMSATFTMAALYVPGQWGWRMPVLFQIAGPIGLFAFTCTIPESPRWLISKNRNDQALQVLAKYHANGAEDDPLVEWEYQTIHSSIHEEALLPKTSYLDFFRTSGNRRRLLVTVVFALGTNWVGNGIISYYLSPILKSVGVTSSLNITAINLGLAVWNLILAQTAALNVEKFGRRPLLLISTSGLIFSYCFVMGFSAAFANTQKAAMGVAAIPFLFIFYGFYDIAWTPLPYAYITEIMPYHLRTKGVAIFAAVQNLGNAFNQFCNPIALAAITWRYYAVYIGIDIVVLALIYFFFPETKNLTIEEVSLVFDYGRKGDRKRAAEDMGRVVMSHAADEEKGTIEQTEKV